MQRINNLNYDHIDDLINYKQTGAIPDYITTSRQRATFRKQFNPFVVQHNELYYDDKQVIKKEDQKGLLNEMYKQFPGHGLNQFYEIVVHSYINITKLEVAAFLKAQTLYQLTLHKYGVKIKTKKYSKANQAWAIDLVDMHRYSNVRANRKYMFIFSIIDLFSKRCYLRKIKEKTLIAVTAELVAIFQHAQPKIIISDNGNEFKLKQFLANYNIKQIFQPSYTPQSNIENLNGQVRKMLQIEFTRHNNLVWVDKLDFIENNLNYYNLEVRKQKDTPDVQLKQKLQVGDKVRVSFSVFDSAYRKNIKAHDQKYNNVKYTPSIFTIYKVYKPKTANGLPYYALQDENNAIIHDEEDGGKILRVKQLDLQFIPNLSDDNDINIDEIDTDKLNKHKGPVRNI